MFIVRISSPYGLLYEVACDTAEQVLDYVERFSSSWWSVVVKNNMGRVLCRSN